MPKLLIKSLLRDRYFLILLITWALNDHVFKYSHPSVWTGKISDVTSLACTPVLMFITMIGAGELLKSRRESRASFERQRYQSSQLHFVLMTFNALSMSALMIGINGYQRWADAYCWGLGLAQWPFIGFQTWWRYGQWPPMPSVTLTMDPTDAWTAPASLISLWLLRRSLVAVKRERSLELGKG